MLERHDGKVVDISRPVFLDIETTGLYEDDEIVEIAIADYDGREIMNEYIKPVYAESWPEAQGIHGISPQTVAHSATFEDQVPAIRAAIRDRVVAVFNAEFELQFLPSHVVVAADLFVCVMEPYREIRGLQKYVKNTYRLQNAMDWCRYCKSQTHRAMEDNLFRQLPAYWTHLPDKSDASIREFEYLRSAILIDVDPLKIRPEDDG